MRFLTLVLAAAVPELQATLSLQTFESPPPQGLPLAYWSATGGAPLTFTNLDSATGERCLLVPAPVGTSTPEVSLPTILLGEDPGFCDLWIKPVSRTLALTAGGQPAEASGVLYLDGAQFLFQRQANRFSILARTRDAASQPLWQRLGGFAGTPVDYEIEDTGGRGKDWLRLTIRRDLLEQTYDVWINGRLAAIDFALDRVAGAMEFRLTHRATATPADGVLAPMLLDDVQASANHPLYADTDRDAMPDAWESAYDAYFPPIAPIMSDRHEDNGSMGDQDGVVKIVEYFYGSRPNASDSDLDGLPDLVEIQHGLNPGSKLDALLDKDGDGFSNLAEHQGQGNAQISLPPAGPLTNVVYVKADHQGTQNGEYATPYKTLSAALQSPSLASGGRIVLRGEGGILLASGNGGLTLTRPVTLVGVNMAQIGLQSSVAFATVSIPTVSASPVLVCENIIFESCRGDDGGAFRIVATPAEVVLRNCRFTGCIATDDGGAIYAHGVKLTLEDCWFYYCWASGEGGAVHAEGDSRLTLRRTYFQNSTSVTDGGAVSLRGATSYAAQIENCVFQSNSAQRGGAVAAVDGADVTLLQSTFSTNSASLAGLGGGFFGASTATLITANGCIFWGNTANGATQPHLAGGLQTVTYSTLSGWTSTLGPAGTGNNGTDPLFRTGTLVPSSTAMLDSSDPAFNSTTDFLNSSRWDAPGGTVGTLADRGAFEKQPDADADGMSDDWETRYTLNTLNAADADSDADQDGYSNLEEFQAKTDPRNDYSLTAPVVFVNPTTGNDWHPGPTPPAGTVSTSQQGSRSYPFKSIRRAILACANGRRIVLMDGTYSGAVNTALKRSESWTWTPHLASTALTSSLSLDTKTIRGLNGAGRVTLDGSSTARLFDLDFYSGASLTLQNLTLRRGYAGTAVGGAGGAIKVAGSAGLGTLTMTACVLASNSATTSGGALHVTGSSVYLTKCTFSANDAPKGGAVALAQLAPAGSSAYSSASITGCRFAYNLAAATTTTDGLGGAISVEASYFSIGTTRFDRNSAGRHGGAIALLSHSGYYPPGINSGTVFASNTAAARGGALYVTNANVRVFGASFEGNSAGTSGASGEGGAVFLAHPSTTTFTSAGYSSLVPELASTRFSKNSVGSRGGAVAMVDVSALLTNCAFTENQAASAAGEGGGISVSWETAANGSPSTPYFFPAPKIIHCTLARNSSPLGSGILAAPLANPWIINSIIGDGFASPAVPRILGPRQLWGSLIELPDALDSTEANFSTRHNIVSTIALAFDWLHLTSPTPATGGVEPSASVVYTRPYADIDGETRPAAAAGQFTLVRGADHFLDSDNDTLPDWFEKLGIDYSSLDAITGLAHLAPLSTALAQPTANPTNNPDADFYTLSRELHSGGRPDMTESYILGRDSDGDGLSDVYEGGDPGLNWRDPDVNEDGVPDGWAIRYFGVLDFDPNGDDDGDGLTNGQEAAAGLNPSLADSDNDGMADADDFDQDGVPDDLEAVPTETAFTFARTPESRYITIPLAGRPMDLSDKGLVLLHVEGELPRVWSAGRYWSPPLQPTGTIGVYYDRLDSIAISDYIDPTAPANTIGTVVLGATETATSGQSSWFASMGNSLPPDEHINTLSSAYWPLSLPAPGAPPYPEVSQTTTVPSLMVATGYFGGFPRRRVNTLTEGQYFTTDYRPQFLDVQGRAYGRELGGGLSVPTSGVDKFRYTLNMVEWPTVRGTPTYRTDVLPSRINPLKDERFSGYHYGGLPSVNPPEAGWLTTQPHLQRSHHFVSQKGRRIVALDRINADPTEEAGTPPQIAYELFAENGFPYQPITVPMRASSYGGLRSPAFSLIGITDMPLAEPPSLAGPIPPYPNGPMLYGHHYDHAPGESVRAIWMLSGQQWVQKSLPTNRPETTPPPGDGLITANSRGEFFTHQHIWRNNHWTPLPDLTSTDISSYIPFKTNAAGHILLIDRVTATAAAFLMPVDVELLTRDTVTGEVSTLNGTVAESLPVPETNITVNSASIVGNNLRVQVTCEVHDPLSELPGVDPIDNVHFLIDGNSVGAAAINSPAQPATIWQARTRKATIQQTLEIPASTGVHTVVVRTDKNAAGNYGSASAYVTVVKNERPAQTVAVSLRPQLSFSGLLSGSVADTVTVLFPGQSPANLTETGPSTLIFSGNAMISGTSKSVELRLKNPAPFTSSALDSVGAILTIHGVGGDCYGGWWRETALASRQFASVDFYIADESASQLAVADIRNSDITSQGYMEPFVVRFGASSMLQQSLQPAGFLKLTLNGQEVSLVEKAGFPVGSPSGGLFVADGNQPRLFALLRQAEGTSLTPTGAVSQGKLLLELRNRADDTVLWSQDHSVTTAPPAILNAAPPGSGLMAAAPPSVGTAQALTNAEFEEQMYAAFEVFFQDYGQRLLNAARNAPVSATIKLESIWLDFDNWDIDDFTDGAYQAGKRPIIRIDRADLKSPVKAAQALYEALYDLFHSWETSLIIQGKSPSPEDPGGLSEEDAAIQYQLTQGQYIIMADALGDAAFAIETGISILSPATGVVLGLGHVAVAWEDGDAASATAQAALLAFPFAAKWAVKTSKPLIIKLGRFGDDAAEELVFPVGESTQLMGDVLRTYAKDGRIAAMRELRPLIENGSIPMGWIDDMYEDMGWFRTPEKHPKGADREILKEGLTKRYGKKPTGTEGQHDLAVGTHRFDNREIDLTKEFLKRGLDPNDGEYWGRWMKAEVHKAIHANNPNAGIAKSGVGNGGGPFNYEWWAFFDQNPQATTGEVLALLEDLVDATTEPPPIRTAWDVQWPIPLPVTQP